MPIIVVVCPFAPVAVATPPPTRDTIADLHQHHIIRGQFFNNGNAKRLRRQLPPDHIETSLQGSYCQMPDAAGSVYQADGRGLPLAQKE